LRNSRSYQGCLLQLANRRTGFEQFATQLNILHLIGHVCLRLPSDASPDGQKPAVVPLRRVVE
jgi:hypothetical protein